jgi:hypothetical protein
MKFAAIQKQRKTSPEQREAVPAYATRIAPV